LEVAQLIRESDQFPKQLPSRNIGVNVLIVLLLNPVQ